MKMAGSQGSLGVAPVLGPTSNCPTKRSLPGVKEDVLSQHLPPLSSLLPWDGEREGCERKSKESYISFPAPRADPQHPSPPTHTPPGLRVFLLWNWILRGPTIPSVFWLSRSNEPRCLTLEFSHGFKIWFCSSVPCRGLRGLPWVCFPHPVKKQKDFGLVGRA